MLKRAGVDRQDMRLAVERQDGHGLDGSPSLVLRVDRVIDLDRAGFQLVAERVAGPVQGRAEVGAGESRDQQLSIKKRQIGDRQRACSHTALQHQIGRRRLAEREPGEGEGVQRQRCQLAMLADANDHRNRLPSVSTLDGYVGLFADRMDC